MNLRKDRTTRLYNLHLVAEDACDETGMPILDSVDIDLNGKPLLTSEATLI